MKVLVVNAGSSSLKFQLFSVDGEYTVLAKGLCDNVGIQNSKIKYTKSGEKSVEIPVAIENHSVATKLMADALMGNLEGCSGVISDMKEISAVGHRIVHGGPFFSSSVVVTDDVMEKLAQCYEYAPLHTNAHIQGIKGCQEVMPETPMVLVFDTAFHTTCPDCAKVYPIPYEMTSEMHIKRYGAHGTSHRYVSLEMCRILGKTEGTRIITCHLGNGSSISAVKDGKCIDTSMGLTPLAGVEMGTRCGDIDPAIVPIMMKKYNLSVDEINTFMNKKCGLLGVSGYSSDMRDILGNIENGGESADRCALAVDILTYGIKKFIGSYAAALDGVDAIVFTAGIGENNGMIRAKALENMSYLGIKIDENINAATKGSSGITKISTDDSAVAVYMIPTDEEYMIAKDTLELTSTLN